jgi:hypothetical protein
MATTPLAHFQNAWNYANVEFVSTTFRHSSRSPRFLGPGEPLISSSWRNRPFHVGWFVGGLFPGELISGRVDQETSLFGGYRVGWDFDHYWGTEWRIGWSRPDLVNLQQPQVDRSARLMVTDLGVLYYPWGDSVVRPYGLLGMGIAEIDYRDDFGIRREETLFGLPLGGGVKHHYRRWLSWRAELLYNFAFGGATLAAQPNFSINFGIEVHFGRKHPSYFSWDPSRHTW